MRIKTIDFIFLMVETQTTFLPKKYLPIKKIRLYDPLPKVSETHSELM